MTESANRDTRNPRPLRLPRVVCLTNGVFQENCYIVADPETHDAVLVDPGEEADLFLRRLASEELALRAVWLTHAHLDHILGVAEVVERTGVPVSLHPADRSLYDGAVSQGAWLGVRADRPPPPEHELAAGDTLELARSDSKSVTCRGTARGVWRLWVTVLRWSETPCLRAPLDAWICRAATGKRCWLPSESS